MSEQELESQTFEFNVKQNEVDLLSFSKWENQSRMVHNYYEKQLYGEATID